MKIGSFSLTAEVFERGDPDRDLSSETFYVDPDKRVHYVQKGSCGEVVDHIVYEGNPYTIISLLIEAITFGDESANGNLRSGKLQPHYVG